MGIVNRITNKIIDGAVEKAEAAALIGVLGAVEVAAEASVSAASFVSKTVTKIVDQSNTSALKKENRKQENVLYVSKDIELGEGIYTVISKKKEKKYNTLLEQDNAYYSLKLYSENNGLIASIQKDYVIRKGFFKQTVEFVGFSLVYKSQYLGHIQEAKEGKQNVYITDFNNWVITGDFDRGNYKVFDKDTGKTVAEIAKKFKSASLFSIVCEHDKNEAILVAIAIMLDLTN